MGRQSSHSGPCDYYRATRSDFHDEMVSRDTRSIGALRLQFKSANPAGARRASGSLPGMVGSSQCDRGRRRRQAREDPDHLQWLFRPGWRLAQPLGFAFSRQLYQPADGLGAAGRVIACPSKVWSLRSLPKDSVAQVAQRQPVASHSIIASRASSSPRPSSSMFEARLDQNCFHHPHSRRMPGSASSSHPS